MIKNIVISIVRQLLSAALGGAITWLIAQGAVTSIQIDLVLAAFAAFLVNIAWSVLSHLIVKWKLDVALNLPSGTSGDVLHEISKATGPFQKAKEVLSPAPLPEDERATGRLEP